MNLYGGGHPSDQRFCWKPFGLAPHWGSNTVISLSFNFLQGLPNPPSPFLDTAELFYFSDLLLLWRQLGCYKLTSILSTLGTSIWPGFSKPSSRYTRTWWYYYFFVTFVDYNIYLPGLNLNRCLSLWFKVNTPMERTYEDLFGTSIWPGFSKTSSRTWWYSYYFVAYPITCQDLIRIVVYPSGSITLINEGTYEDLCIVFLPIIFQWDLCDITDAQVEII